MQGDQKGNWEKLKSFLSIDNTLHWIGILFVLLVVLNGALLFVYQQKTSSSSIWIAIWEYLESDAFKYVTISLLFPIFSLFLENLFEVRKAVDERIKENRKAAKERREKDRQEGLEARLKCIDQTSKVWNEIFTLLSEVRFYKKGGKKKSGEMSIKDLEKKLDNLVNSASEIASKWYFMFPNLRHTRFEDCALYFLDMLFYATHTITYLIQKENDPEEIERLQYTLRAIQNGVKGILYYRLISILKNSTIIWESTMDGKRAEKTNAEKEISVSLKGLIEDAEKCRAEELKNNDLLSSLEESEALQKAAKEVEQIIKTVEISEKEVLEKLQLKEFSHFKNREVTKQQDPEYTWKIQNVKEEILMEKFCKSKEFGHFCHLFSEIEHERLAQMHPYYSKVWVEHLSDWLYFDSVANYLFERAKWTRAIEKQGNENVQHQ